MKSIKKKVGKILLSLTTVFAMVLTMMPTNVFAAGTPSATISDVTVSGYTNVEIPRFTTPYSATITLQNAQFMFSGNENVAPYCEGVPSGMTVNIHTTPDDFSIGTVTFYGTPTEISNAPITITIPKDKIWPQDNDIAVTVNPNAKWNIEKNNLDDATPLAKTAITNITATNDTEATDILDAVTSSITSVADVSATWKAEPTITKATKKNTGSITGTIVLTYKTLTAEVIVNKTIAKLPMTDKEKIEEAKPLAQSAITAIIATNNTTAGNILDAVTTAISSVDGVTASWKADSPIITLATKENAGSITGTIVLTCGSETVEVEVNKAIALLPITDKDKVDEAKPLAISALGNMTVTNDTTAGNILDVVTTGISSVNGVTASWKSGSPTITPATKNSAGYITGVIILTCGSDTVEVDVNKTIAQLPITDKDKVDEAKPLAQSAITALTATNNTTAGNILNAVTTAISSVDGVSASWKATPTITKATSSEAGSITGIIVLTCGSETVEVSVNKLIEKLPAPTLEAPTITTGNSGSNHQIKSGNDMTFTCSGKLEDLTGIYVDGKLVDASNYTLKSGSTILTLKSRYLDSLSAGKHTLKFQYKDNISAETDFTITAKEAPKNDSVIKDTTSPKTSVSSSSAFYTLLFVLLGGIVVTITYRSKKNFNN